METVPLIRGSLSESVLLAWFSPLESGFLSYPSLILLTAPSSLPRGKLTLATLLAFLLGAQSLHWH